MEIGGIGEARSALMVTAELSPLVKAGGLGDVLGSLPLALKKEGMDVRVMMPLYGFIDKRHLAGMRFIKDMYVYLGWRKQYCGIFEVEANGVTVYLIDSQFYFGGDRLYYNMEDDIERFAYFCMAALSALPHIDFMPDVIHCHDWHTSLVPVIYHAHFKKIQYYSGIKIVMTVHNLKYQGICNKYKLYDVLGLNDHYAVAPSLGYGWDAVNCLKGGISVADKVTTVSESYAREIRYPFYGEGLDWLLRWRGHDLVGILNGIDDEAYDPSMDTLLAARYTGRDEGLMDKRRANKLALQEALGLEKDAAAPLIAMVTRLVGQKGLDLVRRVFDEIMDISPDEAGRHVAEGAGDAGQGAADAAAAAKAGGGAAAAAKAGAGAAASAAKAGASAKAGGGGAGAKRRKACAGCPKPQFVLLGTGDDEYVHFFRGKESQYRGRASAIIGFDETAAHRIYAGADFFLMPSLFEPCGISQMIALRYGALPIVRETGGLIDTVKPYDDTTGEGYGYSFANYNAHEMLHTIWRALGVYACAPAAHERLVRAAMERDNSWRASARRYAALYGYMFE